MQILEPYQRLANEISGIRARGGVSAHARRKLVNAIKGWRHTLDAHRLVEQIARRNKLEDKVALHVITGEECQSLQA